jgi:membrane associated rhomboid family serine protease
MAVANFPAGADEVNLDACSRCQLVWMEWKEQRKLPPLVPTGRLARVAPGAPAPGRPVPVKAPPTLKPPPVPTVARPPHAPPVPGKAGAAAHPPPLPRPREGRAGLPRPATPPPAPVPPPPRPAEEELIEHEVSPWQYLPAILGLPVELSSPMARGRPLWTWLVAGAAVAVYIFLEANQALEQAINDWGFIPDQWTRHGGLTLLTSMFLHAGVLHLAGNLYFLLVFGDNVEDRLGGVRYLLLLVCSHLAGIALHGLAGAQGGQPCVGASAAISGVLAYYAVIYPHAKIGFLVRILFFFGPWIRLRAYVWLLLFVLGQLVGAYFQVQGFGGVSYLAHLGGLSVGAVTALWSRLGRASPVTA